LLTPIFMPIAMEIGIDPIQFGIIMCLNLILGVATPPIGSCLFLVSGMAKVPIGKLSKMVLIFIIPLLVVLFLITYIPILTLWIPSIVFG